MTTSIMLLNSGSNAPAYWGEPLSYNTETLLDDVSKQMAASNLIRKHSRGASGQRGGSMRIVKTGSAGVSPRSSTMLNRRRTLMTDNPYRRKPLSFDQNGAVTAVGNNTNDRMQPPLLANRPVSWHASSHLAPQSAYLSSLGYPVLKSEFNGAYDNQELISTPAVYSGYASPASTFSPLSQPFTDYRQQAFQYTDDSFFPNHFNTVNNGYTSYPPPEATQPETHSYSNSDNMDPSMYSHFDWDNFAANGFDSSTAPPTPENFLPIQQPDPSFEAEEAIPYHPLEDTEPGEVLVGMGLYDAPEKSPEADPQLDNYRALMMSQLLGTPYRKQELPTATGKGLKLEETWNPPPSDDDDDDDDEDGDNEEDADGSEADESSEEASSTPAENNGTAMYNNLSIVNPGNGLRQGHNGWL